MSESTTEKLSSLDGRKVILHDMCLRDGMHAKGEQISVEEMVRVATALDDANVPYIQVTHGAGLGGNSLQHGFSMATNEEYISAVAPLMKQAIVSVLLIPGMGTMKELQSAYDAGARSVHVATHCTEANTSPQHIAFARKLGMDTTGFLMMAHLNTAKGLAEQAALMESYGAQTVYLTDSAGYMLPEDVTRCISALRDTLKPETEIGFHGHHNLGMGIANSIAAIEAGASRIDGSAAGLGAGAGNTPLEVFAAVCERMGIETGIDLFKLMDLSENIILPLMDHVIRVDRESLTLGYAGVYSTFLLHAKRASERFGIPARDILVELGRKKMIAGQEDMIVDTAMTMAKQRGIEITTSV
ncbi:MULTISPECIES: 4-hydroxy-2-oxovalerate aldolase [Cycloclasticus]|jgi:4-hydroxy-2-oxovalerate/4-hydroxy-2-oxohexanoate aldolase|uniref:4-hydroxy-2-oxovalerate aldolase n=1 Tax=Cycloclasticus zancles 78-ME TaxID=1198232 RepID=S5TET0_9GAMM|nr:MULTISPECIES: 4-hydroxy-2-oxovalerate aldolase [Cycloclasticus]AGS39302.1 4-hydroxy-2-oxovalerate/4-hydroxy-2-oxohexanoate aldolase [Cycloclasticus zancles 78-ME]MBV1898953.1 4-hydroxy-2-oxovalerate aldolase [Cycloclasticus sp.]PHR48535.1 MAG: 4-hydroxy-2-oxovalerate aldolase [Cycloclasticus sp.]SHI45151.1 4-hydroxy-2-oxovalerate aldolase [Cycloclasticus pugetii]|tara:strand:+ start:2787 stop:3857 length:1071 start_codon:yes stop_codon:yes gene_type:complete